MGQAKASRRPKWAAPAALEPWCPAVSRRSAASAAWAEGRSAGAKRRKTAQAPMISAGERRISARRCRLAPGAHRAGHPDGAAVVPGTVHAKRKTIETESVSPRFQARDLSARSTASGGGRRRRARRRTNGFFQLTHLPPRAGCGPTELFTAIITQSGRNEKRGRAGGQKNQGPATGRKIAN